MKKTILIGLLVIGLIFQNCKNNKPESETIKDKSTNSEVQNKVEKPNTLDSVKTNDETTTNIDFQVNENNDEQKIIKVESPKKIEKEVVKTVKETVKTLKEVEIEKVVVDKVEKGVTNVESRTTIDKKVESTKQIEVSEEKVEEAVKAVPEPIIEKVKTVVSDVANWIVPAKYEKMTNPEIASKENIAIGKTMYSKHCKSCHGSNGEGDGPKADEVEGDLGDFTSKKFQSQSDGALFYKSYIGRLDMPNFEKKMTEEDMWLTVHYMRTMAE